MSVNEAIRRTVTVANPRGFHMRAAMLFIQACRRYKATIVVWNGDKRADARSMMDLLSLNAPSGTELVLELDGEDAADAIGPLGEILESPGTDDY